MPTAEELTVAIKSQGVDETQQDLEGVEKSMDETADSAGDSADNLEGFSEKFSGAMTAAVTALAVGAAGLLSQVPVLGELFSGLRAIIEAVAFQMDGVLRPALSGLTDTFFEIAQAVYESDGSMGDLIGKLASVAAGAGLIAGVLTAVGVTLTGPIIIAIAAVAAAIGALWLAWDNNLGNIQGVVEDTVANIKQRFSRFVSVVKPIIKGFLSAIETFWKNNSDTIMGIVNFAFNFIGTYIEQVIDFILTTIQVLLQFLSGDFKGAWNSITAYFDRTFSRWAPIVSEAVSAIWNVLTDLANDVAGWAEDIASDAIEWGKDIIRGIIDGMASLASNVAEAFEGIINDMISSINAAISQLPDEVSSRLGIEKFGKVDFETDLGTGDSGTESSASVRRKMQRRDGGGGPQIDGRQLGESTGRYRSDPGRRRGL